MTDHNPEIGKTIEAAGLATNYHDVGAGPPVLLIHGSGPGVTAWANWRLVIAPLASRFRVIAPDIAGFGYTQKPPESQPYDMAFWLGHLTAFLDALDLPKVSVVGNSAGGALALALAVTAPERVDRLVLMGAVGLDFDITEGLDKVWGYTPSLAHMRALMDLFVYDKSLLSEDLIAMRYRASIRPGVQENYARMFPAPRQEGVRRLAQGEDAVAKVPHQTLILHGRDDKVIPMGVSVRLHRLIDRSELHVFGQCGHWTQIEKNAGFLALTERFLGAD